MGLKPKVMTTAQVEKFVELMKNASAPVVVDQAEIPLKSMVYAEAKVTKGVGPFVLNTLKLNVASEKPLSQEKMQKAVDNLLTKFPPPFTVSFVATDKNAVTDLLLSDPLTPSQTPKKPPTPVLLSADLYKGMQKSAEQKEKADALVKSVFSAWLNELLNGGQIPVSGALGEEYVKEFATHFPGLKFTLHVQMEPWQTHMDMDPYHVNDFLTAKWAQPLPSNVVELTVHKYEKPPTALVYNSWTDISKGDPSSPYWHGEPPTQTMKPGAKWISNFPPNEYVESKKKKKGVGIAAPTIQERYPDLFIDLGPTKGAHTNMARQWNPDAINESVALPAMDYIGRIKEIAETQTKEAGKLMYVAQLEVVEPAEYAGLLQRDNFVIGSDEDTDAIDPKTWEASLGAKRMKTLFKKSRTVFDKDLDKMRLKAQGNLIGFTIVHKPNPQKPEYPNINVSTYREVASSGNGAGAPVSAATKAPVPVSMPGSLGSVTQAQPATKAKKATIQCPTCDEQVLKTEFAAHAEAHEEEASA